MMRGLRRVAGIWSGTAVVAAIALAAPGAPTLVASSTPTASSQVKSDLPTPPIPVPVPGQSLRERAEQGKSRLDGQWRLVPAALTSWGVDLRSGKLAVDVVGRDTKAVTAFLLLAGVDPTTVVMRTDAAPVRRFYDLVGGDTILGQKYRCSLGVNAKDRSGKLFVLTAGHCTKDDPGEWVGYNKVKIGSVSRTNFPGDDFGSIAVTNSEWKATAKVKGGPTIKGSNVAGFLSKVCRSGSTTGYKCGLVLGYNQTVNYGNGEVVMGLTRTNACAEPGDSGGTFITPSGQAQGFTSGGSGDCKSGGTTFFQPVKEALSAYGLTLVTG
jgi:streptogrisin C